MLSDPTKRPVKGYYLGYRSKYLEFLYKKTKFHIFYSVSGFKIVAGTPSLDKMLPRVRRGSITFVEHKGVITLSGGYTSKYSVSWDDENSLSRKELSQLRKGMLKIVCKLEKADNL